jgi:hypothetical protein
MQNRPHTVSDPQAPSQLDVLRAQLAQQLARRGPDDPYVEHLRWQIGCLERQLRRLDGVPENRLRAPGMRPT